MFVADSSRRYIDLGSGVITTLVESINQPLVAVPGMPSQPAHAIACGLRHGAQFEVLVFLDLLQSNQGVLYVWDEGMVDVDRFREVEAEAVGFMESMGFMVDSLNWSSMPAAQRTEVLSRMPAFHADRAAFRGHDPRETTGPQTQVDPKLLDLARLMAAF